VEAEGERVVRRRAEDDLADRRRLVVDEPELRREPRVVERLGALQPDLLLRREKQLDARVGAPLADDPRRGFEHDCDCRLVVRAEDRSRRVADDPVLVYQRLDRPLRRHGVEVRAEEDRRPAGAVRIQPAVEISGVRADRRARAVLVYGDPEIAQIGGNEIGRGALGPRRRWQPRELQEDFRNLYANPRSTCYFRSTWR
jgi:hypothetical protein